VSCHLLHIIKNVQNGASQTSPRENLHELGLRNVAFALNFSSLSRDSLIQKLAHFRLSVNDSSLEEDVLKLLLANNSFFFVVNLLWVQSHPPVFKNLELLINFHLVSCLHLTRSFSLKSVLSVDQVQEQSLQIDDFDVLGGLSNLV